MVIRIAIQTACVLGWIGYKRTTRRIEWFFLRHIIYKRIRLALLLEKFVMRSFAGYPSIKRATMALYYRPGYGLGESNENIKTLYWEAPLAIALWTKDGPAAGMSVEFRGDTLCIRQLQGVSEVTLTPRERDWPKAFIRGCISFARWTGVKHIRLYRANQSLFYYFPDFSNVPPEKLEEAEEGHRARMRRRYDGTARQLGFVMKPKWGEWTNPKLARL